MGRGGVRFDRGWTTWLAWLTATAISLGTGTAVAGGAATREGRSRVAGEEVLLALRRDLRQGHLALVRLVRAEGHAAPRLVEAHRERGAALLLRGAGDLDEEVLEVAGDALGREVQLQATFLVAQAHARQVHGLVVAFGVDAVARAAGAAAEVRDDAHRDADGVRAQAAAVVVVDALDDVGVARRAVHALAAAVVVRAAAVVDAVLVARDGGDAPHALLHAAGLGAVLLRAPTRAAIHSTDLARVHVVAAWQRARGQVVDARVVARHDIGRKLVERGHLFGVLFVGELATRINDRKRDDDDDDDDDDEES